MLPFVAPFGGAEEEGRRIQVRLGSEFGANQWRPYKIIAVNSDPSFVSPL
jgi:hypothetical protein